MKKILCSMVVFSMVLVFLAVSDVLAVNLANLPDTEWKITGISTRYDTTGAYAGSAVISQGMLYVEDPAEGAIAVTNHGSDLLVSVFGGLFEYYCIHEIGAYTLGVDKIKSTSCSVECYDAALNSVLSFPSGPCTAKILFSSGTQFTGTITIPDLWGADTQGVFTIKGTKVGKWGAITSSTSLRDALRGSAPESLRNLFKK